MPLPAKIAMLLAGAGFFFILFPYLQKRVYITFAAFMAVLLFTAFLFRSVSTRRMFRSTLWLWASGSAVYLVIAAVLILRGVQPLPYRTMDMPQLLLYYLSYPLRVLGIFFVGLIFTAVTSPTEFLRWGEVGLKIALAYRAFEYAVQSLDQTRQALLIQGEWPDPADRGGFGKLARTIRSVPLLITTMFRNIILWYPWAYICYTNLSSTILERKKR
jgi:hypothetical protein